MKRKIHGRKYDKLPAKKVTDDLCHAEWRKQCLERDKFECQLCGKSGPLNVHHILLKQSKRMKYCVLNGITLCVGCHLMGVHSKDMEVGTRFLNHLGIVLGEERYAELLRLKAIKEPMPLVECWDNLNG